MKKLPSIFRRSSKLLFIICLQFLSILCSQTASALPPGLEPRIFYEPTIIQNQVDSEPWNRPGLSEALRKKLTNKKKRHYPFLIQGPNGSSYEFWVNWAKYKSLNLVRDAKFSRHWAEGVWQIDRIPELYLEPLVSSLPELQKLNLKGKWPNGALTYAPPVEGLHGAVVQHRIELLAKHFNEGINLADLFGMSDGGDNPKNILKLHYLWDADKPDAPPLVWWDDIYSVDNKKKGRIFFNAEHYADLPVEHPIKIFSGLNPNSGEEMVRPIRWRTPPTGTSCSTNSPNLPSSKGIIAQGPQQITTIRAPGVVVGPSRGGPTTPHELIINGVGARGTSTGVRVAGRTVLKVLGPVVTTVEAFRGIETAANWYNPHREENAPIDEMMLPIHQVENYVAELVPESVSSYIDNLQFSKIYFTTVSPRVREQMLASRRQPAGSSSISSYVPWYESSPLVWPAMLSHKIKYNLWYNDWFVD